MFEADRGGPAQQVERLDLPKGMALHDFHGDGPHPLYEVGAIIAGSVGKGFADRMAARGITAVATSEPDPAEAVKAFLEDRLPPALPHDHADEGCAHD